MLFYLNLPVKSKKITSDSWPETAATATKPHKTHNLTKIVDAICSKNIFQLFLFGPLVKIVFTNNSRIFPCIVFSCDGNGEMAVNS